MQKRSDDRLIAYLDGELEMAERREIEAWLDTDPTAREKQTWCASPLTRSCMSLYPIG